MRKTNLDKEKAVIQEYLMGDFTTDISRRHRISHGTVRRILIRNQITISTRDSSRYRKYSLNDNFFDCLDTPAKHYILGLFYADGNNDLKRRTVSIGLIETDIDILVKINQLLNSNRPICEINQKHNKYSKNKFFVLKLTSKIMSERLSYLGMVPNKTFKLEWPKYLEGSMVKHFIRGVLDGDGCIYVDNGKCHMVQIAGTYQLLKGIESAIKKLSINSSISKNGKIFSFNIYGGNQCEKFLDWIYEDSNGLFINRKFIKYQELKNR